VINESRIAHALTEQFIARVSSSDQAIRKTRDESQFQSSLGVTASAVFADDAVASVTDSTSGQITWAGGTDPCLKGRVPLHRYQPFQKSVCTLATVNLAVTAEFAPITGISSALAHLRLAGVSIPGVRVQGFVSSLFLGSGG
jgi:hypothetical protein